LIDAPRRIGADRATWSGVTHPVDAANDFVPRTGTPRPTPSVLRIVAGGLWGRSQRPLPGRPRVQGPWSGRRPGDDDDADSGGTSRRVPVDSLAPFRRSGAPSHRKGDGETPDRRVTKEPLSWPWKSSTTLSARPGRWRQLTAGPGWSPAPGVLSSWTHPDRLTAHHYDRW